MPKCRLPPTSQALAHCPPLTHYLRCCTALYRPLLDKGGRGKPDARTKMTTAFTDAVCELLKGGPEASQTPVRPLELLDAVSELMPTFRRHEQQDAHELLRLVLQQSHEQLLRRRRRLRN
jgi:ubiquitin C-terminal hydrolase